MVGLVSGGGGLPAVLSRVSRNRLRWWVKNVCFYMWFQVAPFHQEQCLRTVCSPCVRGDDHPCSRSTTTSTSIASSMASASTGPSGCEYPQTERERDTVVAPGRAAVLASRPPPPSRGSLAAPFLSFLADHGPPVAATVTPHYDRRKKEAREAHRRSQFAQKVHGLRAKLYNAKRYKEKATMRKT